MKYVILSIVAISMLLACKEEKICTEEFRSITLEVNGIVLSESYTINIENNDTLIFNNWSENSYTVLDDSYENNLNENPSSFQFHGFINDSLWVNETYQIQSDGCHITKVSGESVINF